MRSIRGLVPEAIECTNPALNIFKACTGGFTFTVRQPRRQHTSAHRRAWGKLSPQSKQRYRRKYVDGKYYDVKYRCRLPVYKAEVPGWVPLLMIVEDKIVGVADMMFKYGSSFRLHRIGDGEVGCSMNLCVLDKYQGTGIGNYYSYISVFIAKHFGADYALGYTTYKKGMFNIRMREGWEHVGRQGGWAVIQKKLK